MTSDQERYTKALQDLYLRTTQGIKLGLDNTRQLLQALGNPQDEMKHVVIAGTNGKGSTSSLLAATCKQAGHKTGLYTSPHLLRFTERIQINNQEITQESVLKYYDQIRAVEAACDALPTFFEVTTAMALLAFAEANVEIAVMEVGLGGRLDSTNVVDKCISIITPIALDHVHILGDTLAVIAGEKAGIIASGAPVLSAKQEPDALGVLKKVAADKETKLYPCAPFKQTHDILELGNNPTTHTVHFQGPEYQACNINTVFHALPLLQKAGFPIDLSHFQNALKAWQWPGRFQKLSYKSEVILDGAHNPHALEALMGTLSTESDTPIHVVFSAIHTKDAGQMIDTLKRNAKSVHLCPSSVGKSLNQKDLHALCPDLPTYASAELALEKACNMAQQGGGKVLVTGSLFLVADILHFITGENRDPGVVS